MPVTRTSFAQANHISLLPIMEHHDVKKVAIVGTTVETYLLYRELTSLGITVEYFLSFFTSRRRFYGKPVISAEDIKDQSYFVDMIIYADNFPYREKMQCLQLLKKICRIVYDINQLYQQRIVADYNVPMLTGKKFDGVDKYFLLHYTLGAIEHINPIDAPLLTLNKISQMQENPACYKYIFGDIPYYNDAYLAEITHCPKFADDSTGFPINMLDRKSNFLNVIGGKRVTTDVPNDYTATIHLLGPCMSFGYGAEDKYTIASYIQRLCNTHWMKKIRVLNHSLIDHQLFEQNFEHILHTIDVVNGDKIVIFSYSNYGLHQSECEDYMRNAAEKSNIKFISSYETINRNCFSERMFISERHLSHNGNRLYANLIFHSMDEEKSHRTPVTKSYTENRKKDKQKNIPEEKKQKIDVSLLQYENDALISYIHSLKKVKDAQAKNAGAIVMNCNPFTLGHEYLVTKALDECDYLYVFIVEEDASFFPFNVRYFLARSALRKFARVKVLPSGKFIISRITMEEYFNKDDFGTTSYLDASLDLGIFSRHIAPALEIRTRFVGEEPTCELTRQYNMAMKDMLPKHGIELNVIKRLEANGIPVSASRVRFLVQNLQLDGLQDYVPETTLAYLMEKYAPQHDS